MTLRDVIREEIERAGGIPFSRYMELCLYHPELGYYARAGEKFGKAGDFYTSSDVHAVFGRLLARQFDEMWRALGEPARLDLIELGPGRGLFARDVLDWSAKTFPAFARALRYTLVERSPSLRAALADRLGSHVEQGSAVIAEELPNTVADHAILFANEFFDALPVEVVSDRGQLWLKDDAGGIAEDWRAPASEVLAYLDRYGIQPEFGERVEACLIAQEWMTRAAALLRRGFLVAVDYGYTRDELLAGRHRGTVTAIRKHAVSRDPYEAPGEQDITAHVNFTALAAAGEAAGLAPLGLITQSQFLLGIGEATEFADAFEDVRLPQEHAKVALQLKHLITPAGMGETFHVLVMGRETDARLSGLSFAQ
jgi:SAM-dependent MidA family methyltransferase